MSFGAVVADSWRIFWKHKSIWIFGILLALGGQLSDLSWWFYTETVVDQPGWLAPPGVTAVGGKLAIDWPLFLTVFLLTDTLFTVLALLPVVVGRGMLIGVARQAEKDENPSTGQSWQAVKERFKPLFWLAFVLILPALVFELLVASSTAFMQTAFTSEADRSTAYVAAQALSILGVCGLAIVALLTYYLLFIIRALAVRLCLLEKLGVRESLRGSWKMLRGNLRYTLLSGLLFYALEYVFNILADIPIKPLWTPVKEAILQRSWEAAGWQAVNFLPAVDYLLAYGFLFILLFGCVVWLRRDVLDAALQRAGQEGCQLATACPGGNPATNSLQPIGISLAPIH